MDAFIWLMLYNTCPSRVLSQSAFQSACYFVFAHKIELSTTQNSWCQQHAEAHQHFTWCLLWSVLRQNRYSEIKCRTLAACVVQHLHVSISFFRQLILHCLCSILLSCSGSLELFNRTAGAMFACREPEPATAAHLCGVQQAPNINVNKVQRQQEILPLLCWIWIIR